ncbi:MAG TPA: RNA methyltransferase [Gemmatimonadales bacterium]|nr:RNA methyltransferase [Gemmatimonadales bacterium]
MTSNLVSLVRNLQQRKGRRRRNLTIADGVRLVEEALNAGVRMTGVLVSPAAEAHPRTASLLQTLADHAVPVETVSERDMRALADTETSQGIVAVIEPRRWSLADIHVTPAAPVLVLDGVQDPGNVGTLLRTALALGAGGAILLAGTADPFNPKALRAAAGASFRLPAAPATDEELRGWVARSGVTVWAAATEGSSVRRLKRPDRLALVVGNEGAGVRPAIRSLAAEQVAIPLAAGVESLNVAVAAGILLFHVTRES